MDVDLSQLGNTHKDVGWYKQGLEPWHAGLTRPMLK